MARMLTEEEHGTELNAYSAYWLWWDFSQIAGSAVKRQRNVDRDCPPIDWERQEQSMRIAGLSFACSLFESLDVKERKPHNTILAHIRNAVIHNNGNIKENRSKPIPFNESQEYLRCEDWKEMELGNPFFKVSNSGKVYLKSELFLFIEKLLRSQMTDEQRSMPAPIFEE